MNSPIFPLVRHASLRPALIVSRLFVLATGLASAGFALAAPVLPAESLAVGSCPEATARPDWNVDYPSQLGANGPSTAEAARPALKIDGSTRPDWNADYPSQLSPEGPRVETSAQAHIDLQRRVPMVDAGLQTASGFDYPSQIGPEGLRADAQ